MKYGDSSVISSGFCNIAYCTIGSQIGGFQNMMIAGIGTNVIGGKYNMAFGNFGSSIIGGQCNRVYGTCVSSIIGGRNNVINGDKYCSQGSINVIVGGSYNSITGASNSTVIGGYNNQICQSYNSVIIGGKNLILSGLCDTVMVPNLATATVSNATASQWKLGKAISQSVSVDTTQYIEVMIDGTVYKIVVAS
jgi:hypothetical protein